MMKDGVFVSFSNAPDYYVNSFNRKHIKEATGLNNKKFRIETGSVTVMNKLTAVTVYADGRVETTPHEQLKG